MKMNIDQLALEVAAMTNLSQHKAKEVAREIFNMIAENVADGHEVNVPGFGKFGRHQSKARTGRNPKTGEAIDLPAKVKPKFTPAKDYRTIVSERWDGK